MSIRTNTYFLIPEFPGPGFRGFRGDSGIPGIPGTLYSLSRTSGFEDAGAVAEDVVGEAASRRVIIAIIDVLLAVLLVGPARIPGTSCPTPCRDK